MIKYFYYGIFGITGLICLLNYIFATYVTGYLLICWCIILTITSLLILLPPNYKGVFVMVTDNYPNICLYVIKDHVCTYCLIDKNGRDYIGHPTTIEFIMAYYYCNMVSFYNTKYSEFKAKYSDYFKNETEIHKDYNWKRRFFIEQFAQY